jgi:hypothetical protein
MLQFLHHQPAEIIILTVQLHLLLFKSIIRDAFCSTKMLTEKALVTTNSIQALANLLTRSLP